ncbi:phasin family protein [Pseudooceanicola nanhaiensis]|uniref:phasin family protein n=1 Tax=Pseudooceanicola nanhaiensis TaxID=375761 RepID=UPI001CD57EF4|nr:phasin family protein [Pseudooceanicola nanhaiensis]MCA0922230.1 phasin family protein [Pseudooceanicola nanhaiensis]
MCATKTTAAKPAGFMDSKDMPVWPAAQFFETLMEFGSELSTFTAARMKEDVDFTHTMLHCRTPAELYQAQLEFYKKAVNDYHDEAGKLVEIGRKIGFEEVI